jgi:predicted nucleotidyltransferase
MNPISPQILEDIKTRLVKKFDLEKIVIFGSFAWGNPKEANDLDLMVIVSNSDLNPVKRDIEAHKCLRGIRIPMDIIVKTEQEFNKYKGVIASLEYKIENNGIVLYGR